MLQDMKFFAKGHRSIVYIGLFRGKKAAAKVARPGFEHSIRGEAEWLRILNARGIGIGPKLFEAGNNYIIISFVAGKRIIEYLKDSSGKNCIAVIMKVLQQCRLLDKLFVNKQELQNPYKHIIVGKKVVMIDFERCKSTEKPKNVTQFCQFLVSGKISSILSAKGINPDKENLRKALIAYKKDYSEENFSRVKKALFPGFVQ